MPDHAPRPAGRRIALIAHDNKKRDMLEWAEYNLDLLAGHDLSATATTGHLLQQQLGLPVTCFRSGPYGGDQPPGAGPGARPGPSQSGSRECGPGRLMRLAGSRRKHQDVL